MSVFYKGLSLTAVFCAAALFFSSCGLDLNGSEKRSKQIFAMDTIVELTVYGKNAEQATESAAAKIMELEAELSATKADSAVSKINSALGAAVTVSDNVKAPLLAALDISSKSKGAFDITVFPFVKAWGFVSKEYRVPGKDELSRLQDFVGFKKIEINGNAVSVPNGTEIDLGGIAKGYTSQCVCDILKESGVTGAVISLGGNAQTVGGKPDGSKWRIAVCDPDDPDNGTIGTLSVDETAVVTSGGYQRFFESGGRKYHHIINPSTGYPSESGLKSVTVVCADGTYADGLSTALFVLGLEDALAYRKSHGGFDAVFVSDDGTITITSGLKDLFTPAQGRQFSLYED